MPLISAKCTQCGAPLEVDSAKDAAICPFCNTPFIVEKAINYYNTTNVTNIEAGVVQVQSGETQDTLAQSGETFIKFNDYDSAKAMFEKLTNTYPFDARGWYGLAKVYSENFSKIDIHKDEYAVILSCKNKLSALDVANDPKYAKLNQYINNVIEHSNKQVENAKNNLIPQQNGIQEKIREHQQAYNKMIQEITKQYKDRKKYLTIGGFAIFFIILAIAFIIIFIFPNGIENSVATVALAILFGVGFSISVIFLAQASTIEEKLSVAAKELYEERMKTENSLQSQLDDITSQFNFIMEKYDLSKK